MKHAAATTHHGALDELRQVAPTVDVQADVRVVDSGRLIFFGRISAGIDAAFYLVAKLLGQDVALDTATYMEYDWSG